MNTLALPIRAEGGPAQEIHPEVVRAITFEDLPRAHQRTTQPVTLDKIRARHHQVAMMIAAGKSHAETEEITGLSYQRICMLAMSPAFQELIEEKRKFLEAEQKIVILDNFRRHERLHTLALESLQERLEEDPDKFTNTQLMSLISDEADRLGPTKRTLQVNANFDFADRLAAARKKMFGEDAKVVPELGSPSLERPGADRRLAGEGQ